MKGERKTYNFELSVDGDQTNIHFLVGSTGSGLHYEYIFTSSILLEENFILLCLFYDDEFVLLISLLIDIACRK